MTTTDETKRTPGPWRVDDRDPACVVGPRGLVVADVFGPPGTDNAHLIAAAPELLRALEGTRIALCCASCPAKGYPYGEHTRICAEATAALASALGR